MHLTVDDATVPAMGFGTFQLDDARAEQAVHHALEVGYRHIDTATAYGNETGVGRALAAHPLDRDEVFVTTKVWRDDAARDDVHRSARASLDRLGLDHVDLLLLHWPAEDIAPLEETLAALTEVRDAGLTRFIGVSNFPSAMLDRAFGLAPIVTDQVEHHTYLAVDPIRRVLAERGGFLTAYSPIARGRVVDDPVLTEIGREHGAEPVQVALAYLLVKGNTAVIPRSGNPDRIRTNLDAAAVRLTEDEVARIDALARGQRLVQPAFGPAWDTD